MRTNFLWLPGLLALCFAQAIQANEKVIVMVPAILDANAPIIESVKRDCAVEASVGNQTLQHVRERFPGTEQSQNPTQPETDSPVLKITILNVRGVGGGSWSGTKAITIRADLTKGAQTIGSKIFLRKSGGGVLGGVSGTCAIMDRIAEALGRDVANWLPGALTITKREVMPSDQSVAQATKDGGESPAAADKPASESKQ